MEPNCSWSHSETWRYSKFFLRKINGISNNYWECLKQTKIYSLQRQRERYRIMYVWKSMEKIVPAVNGITMTENPRLGRMCTLTIPKNQTSKFRDSTLAVQGAKLFNAMPKSIRNLKNVSIIKFKSALDNHLKSIPDEPQIHGYTGCRRAMSNSIIDMKNVCWVPLLSTDTSLRGVVHQGPYLKQDAQINAQVTQVSMCKKK